MGRGEGESRGGQGTGQERRRADTWMVWEGLGLNELVSLKRPEARQMTAPLGCAFIAI